MGEVERLGRKAISSLIPGYSGIALEKVAHLSLGQLWLNRRPSFTLGSVAQKVHDDSTPRDRLVDSEQVFPRDPAVLLSFLP